MSTVNNPVPSQILKLIIERQKSKNSMYSLRAFARDLGLSPSYISAVINRKKPLSKNAALKVSQKFELSIEEAIALISEPNRDESTQSMIHLFKDYATPNSSEGSSNSDSNLKFDSPSKSEGLRNEGNENSAENIRQKLVRWHVISEWYHSAILRLLTCSNFKSDVSWISQKLDLDEMTVCHALDRLIELGLITKLVTKDDSELKLSPQQNARDDSTQKALVKDIDQPYFRTQQEVSARREYKSQTLNKAIEHLKRNSQNDFSIYEAQTISVAKNRIDQARRKIDEFIKDLANDLGASETNEVFQLNLQFFPLTHFVGDSDFTPEA